MIAVTLILQRVLDGDGLWLTLVASVIAFFALEIALIGTRPLKALAVGTGLSTGLLLVASAH
jgi:hypothetical protein